MLFILDRWLSRVRAPARLCGQTRCVKEHAEAIQPQPEPRGKAPSAIALVALGVIGLCIAAAWGILRARTPESRPAAEVSRPRPIEPSVPSPVSTRSPDSSTASQPPTSVQEPPPQRVEEAPAELPPAPPAQAPVEPPPAPSAHRAQEARELYLEGVRLLGADEPRKADELFQRALAADPGFYRAWLKLGIVRYKLEDPVGEIEAYRRCLELAPDYVPAWINLGHALLASDDLEGAGQAYEKVLSLEPLHADARFNLGLVAYDLARFEESLEHLRRFLALETGTEEENRVKARQYVEELEAKLGRAR